MPQKRSSTDATDARCESLLQAMVDASPDFMVVKDRQLVYRAANSAFLRFLNRRESEVIGKTDFDLFPEAEAEQYRRDDRKVIETGEPITRDEYVSGAEGQRWLQVIKTPLRWGEENDGVLITVRDISDHKRLEQTLTERKERLKTILGNIPVMITFYDAPSKVVHLNRYCEQVLGWSSEEANRIDLMAEVYPDPAYRRMVEEYMARATVEWRRLTLRVRDGRRVESAWSNVRLSDGSQMGIGIDLSERVELEANLRESRQRLQLITETIDDVFWMVSPDLTETLFVSPAYERLWGRSCESVYRDTASFLEAVHPDDRPRLETELIAPHAKGRHYSVDYRIVRSDGEVRWIRDRGYPVRDDQGRLYAMAGICSDITELKASEEEIRKLNATLEQRVTERTAELEAATRELESFSYSVAHDLRAPLRAINGFAGILTEEYGQQLDDEGLNYLERIRGTTVHMGELIEGLLSLSQTSRADLDLGPVDLSALAQSIADELAAAHPERRVEWQIAPGLVVTGDEALLRTLLQNLFDNAWKFTAERDPARITFGRQGQSDGQHRFYVRDNGVGFSMAFAHKLFRAFERLHDGSHRGNGIGLATVKRIVGKHHGRVWAESEEGQGATFWFTLPVSGEE